MAVDRPPWWRRLLGAKAATVPFVVDGAPRWRNVTWKDASFDRLADEGYSKNAVVFACVTALALAYSEAPLQVVSEADGAIQEQHPLNALLRRPNPLMSWSELDTIVMSYCAIGGSCYLHKVRSSSRRPVELWPYHAGQLRPVPDPMGWVRGYEYIGPGDYDGPDLTQEDVIHLKWPSVDPTRPWLPLPPLVASAREVDTTGEIGRYLYALLVNDAVGRTVVTMPAGVELKPAQFRQLQQQFEQRHGGANRGRTLFVEGGAKVDRMALNLEELAWEALARVPQSNITAAFRVPAIIAGVHVGLERATYANFGEARHVFTEDTIRPMWRFHADELTQSLAADFGGGIRVERDTTKVAALQEGADAVYTRARTAWDAGLITRNEARVMLGLPRVEDLGVPELPPGDAFIDEEALPALPAPIDVTPGQRAGGPSLESKALKDASTRRIERRIKRAVAAYLADQYRQAAERIGEVMDGP